jgi:hypothetical protein
MRTHKTVTAFMPIQHEQQTLKCDICDNEVIMNTYDIDIPVNIKEPGWCSIDIHYKETIDVCPVCADKYTINECLFLAKNCK